jgi:uncharacterized protein YqeY
MELRDRLEADLQKAMKERNDITRSVLRVVRSEMHNAEIALQKPMDEDGIIGVISKQVRQHRESIDAFQKGNRTDLVQLEEQELEILLDYLPPQLTLEEVTTLAQQTIQDVGATGPTDRGKVMGKLMPQVLGKAEGSVVNDVVSQLLEKL